MTVYVCTDGSYSDYHIEQIFTDKEQALICCAANGYSLEEYEADAVKLESTKPVEQEFGMHFSRDGSTQYLYEKGLVFEHPFRVHTYITSYYCTATFPIGTDGEFAKKALCDMFATWKYHRIEEGENHG